MKLYFSFLLISIFNINLACSCVETPIMEKAVDNIDIVVMGKILSKEYFSKNDRKLSNYFEQNVHYKMRVTKTFKGKIKNEIITILTGPAMAGDCGVFFQIGKSYIVYAYKIPIKIGGKTVSFFETSICTRTGQFDKNEADKIEKYCQSKDWN